MKNQWEQELPPGTTLIGTTTLRHMINAVYDENDPLHGRNWYSECMCASDRLEEHPEDGDEVVYGYYHEKEDETIMTNVEGDYRGVMGSSAGFYGRVKP